MEPILLKKERRKQKMADFELGNVVKYNNDLYVIVGKNAPYRGRQTYRVRSHKYFSHISTKTGSVLGTYLTLVSEKPVLEEITDHVKVGSLLNPVYDRQSNKNKLYAMYNYKVLDFLGIFRAKALIEVMESHTGRILEVFAMDFRKASDVAYFKEPEASKDSYNVF